MIKYGKNPHLLIEHPRLPEPSRVTLWAPLVGKREDIVQIDCSEEELYVLAEDALKYARVLRGQRAQP